MSSFSQFVDISCTDEACTPIQVSHPIGYAFDIYSFGMKYEELQGRVNPYEFKKYARSRFMETASLVCRPAFIELLDRHYPVYQETQKGSLPTGFERSHEETNPEHRQLLIKLRRRLRAWQKKWHLVEKDSSEKWVVTFLMECGFAHWAASPPPVRHNFLFKSQAPVIEYDEPPPFKQTLIYYDKIYKTPFAPFSKDEYVQEAVNDFRKHVTAYANNIERQLKHEQWKEWDALSVRDLVWTVQSQMEDCSFSQLAELGKIKPYRTPEDKVLIETNEDRLKNLLFEAKSVHPSTVKRAVEKILNLIEISPRQKRMDKRPKRPVQKNIFYSD